MQSIELVLPKLHRDQQRIMKGLGRYNAIACGRRYGKTVLGVHRIVPHVLAGFPCGWFAPTYKYLGEAWRDFKRLLKPVIRYSNKSEGRIELITGGVIEFWSMQDPDCGRSRKYKHVVIDEAAKAPHLRQAYNESIRATLTDFRGSADFLSTPKGKEFFWECYCKGQDPLQPNWRSFTAPTASNPWIHPDEILELELGLPERVYTQEILAQFHDDGGGVFRKVKDAVDTDRTADDLPVIGMKYSQGSDLARIIDFSVNSTVNRAMRQVAFDRYQQLPWAIQCERIARNSRRFHNAPVTFDATAMGGDMMAEQLKAYKMGRLCPFVFTNASKEALIDNLALLFEQEAIRLMDIPEQTSELQAFEYEITKTRKIRMQAPEGLHDDCVMGLALSVWGMNHTRRIEVS
jgi:hypothetical protein